MATMEIWQPKRYLVAMATRRDIFEVDIATTEIPWLICQLRRHLGYLGLPRFPQIPWLSLVMAITEIPCCHCNYGRNLVAIIIKEIGEGTMVRNQVVLCAIK